MLQSKEVDGMPRKWLGLAPDELLRRQKISKSAVGRVPWNKGLKRSEGGCFAIERRSYTCILIAYESGAWVDLIVTDMLSWSTWPS